MWNCTDTWYPISVSAQSHEVLVVTYGSAIRRSVSLIILFGKAILALKRRQEPPSQCESYFRAAYNGWTRNSGDVGVGRAW